MHPSSKAGKASQSRGGLSEIFEACVKCRKIPTDVVIERLSHLHLASITDRPVTQVTREPKFQESFTLSLLHDLGFECPAELESESHSLSMARARLCKSTSCFAILS